MNFKKIIYFINLIFDYFIKIYYIKAIKGVRL